MADASLLPYLSKLHRAWLAEGTPRPGRRQFPATCLLIDVVGFTAITRGLTQGGSRGAEQLNDGLESCFGAVIEVLEAHGGDVLTFAGDALVAGWISEPGDEVRSAVLAAQAALAVQQVPTRADLPLELRCSLGSGTLHAFEVGGVEERWLFQTAGEPLAQAKRADAACAGGEVVASPEAWALLDGRAEGEFRGSAGHRLLQVTAPESLPAPVAPAEPGAVAPLVPRVVAQRADQGSFLAEFRQLCILFANLSDFEPASDGALATLQEVVACCQAEVLKTGGDVYNLLTDDKGTTFLAVWGLPGASHEDDAARALGTALSIRDRLWGSARLGIGVATGRVFCGAYGAERRRHYSIVGPTINLAARLMVAASGDGLLCDRATRRATGTRVEFDDLPPISAKGIDVPVPVHRPRRIRAGRRDQGGRLIGRAPERARLVEALDATLEGRGAAIALVGEAGIGKSQLLRQLRIDARERGLQVWDGAADSIETATSWLAWRSLLADCIGDGGEARVRALLGDAPRLQEWAPLLQAIDDLGLEPNDTTAAMTGPARGLAVADLLAALMDAASGATPSLLVLEDAHWLDTASWQGLLCVARRASRLLIVVASRPPEAPLPPEWTQLLALPATEQITLGALPPEDAVAVACQKLGVDSLPPVVAELLAERAAGHPLFTQELAWALVEEGALDLQDGRSALRMDAAALAALPLPDNLERVITGRIDRLGPQGQLLLKVASVIGRVFSSDLLRAIAPDDDRVEAETEELVEHDLVLPERAPPDPAWIFKHALVRDTAYGLLVFSQRRRLHRAVAEWYERSGEALARHYPILAHHYALAEVGEKARSYLALAGASALRTGASAEAVTFFRRALDLSDEGAEGVAVVERASWWQQMGLAYYALGKKREARSAMLNTLRLAGRPLATSVGGLLLQLLGQYASQARWLLAPKSMIASGETERRLAAEATDAAQYVSTTYYFDKENLPFFVAGLKCASEAARAGETPQSAIGLAYVGVLVGLFQIDRLTLTYFRRSLAIAESLGDANAIARHWQLRAMQRAGCGEWIDDELTAATAFFHRAGDRHEHEVSLTVQALIRTYRGEYEEAGQLYGQLADSATGRSVQHTVWATYKLGELMLLEHGREDEAMPTFDTSLELLAIEPEEPTEASVQWLRGTVLARRGQLQEASDTIHAAMQRLKESPPNTHGMLLAYTFGIWTLLDLQEADPSAQNRERAAFALKQMGIFAFLFPFAKGRLLVLKGRAAQLAGRTGKATKLLTRARALGETTGMRLDVGLADQLLGRGTAGLEALGVVGFTPRT